MSYDWIKQLRLAAVVVMFCGLLFGNSILYAIGIFGFMAFFMLPYLRIERAFYEHVEKHKENAEGDETSVGFKAQEKDETKESED